MKFRNVWRRSKRSLSQVLPSVAPAKKDLSPPLSTLGTDILFEICRILDTTDRDDNDRSLALLALSKTSKAIRAIALPFVFRKIVITDEPKTTGAPDPKWKIFSKKIRKLIKESWMHEHIKSIEFLMLVYHQEFEPPPAELVKMHIQLIQKLVNLTSLHLELPKSHVDLWGSAMQSAKLVLPSVTTLHITERCIFMICLCPNVSAIRRIARRSQLPVDPTDNRLSFLQAALMASKLTKFQFGGNMIDSHWSREMTTADMIMIKLSSCFHPNKIEHLAVIVAPESGLLEQEIRKLSQLPRLQSLTFGAVEQLGLGFHPVPPFSPDDWDSGGDYDNWANIVEKEERRLGNDIIRMVDAAFGKTSALSRVRIGHSSAFKRIPNGIKCRGRVGNWVRVPPCCFDYQDYGHCSHRGPEIWEF